MQKEKTSHKILMQNVNGHTNERTDRQTDEQMERRKLYTPRHTSYTGGIIKQQVITPKVRKPELSLLYATRHLILTYISTKYYQNIPKRIQVTEWTRTFTPTPTGSIPKTICPPTLW